MRNEIVGVDFVSPDLALSKRDQTFDWPIHQTLLSQGTLIAENVAQALGRAGQGSRRLGLAREGGQLLDRTICRPGPE